jgi:hypothetical protein
MTKIPPVKKTLKVLAVLASVAVLWIGYSYMRFLRDEADPCVPLTLNGDINSNSFTEARHCLVSATAAKKTFVVKQSGGGNGAAALALGILIHRHHWDVEVVGLCASSCANFIFPAGKSKYLHENALLVFHGGFYQENMMAMMEEFDRGTKTNGTPTEPVTLGQVNKEGTVTFSPDESKETKEVRAFLGLPDASTAVERLAQLRIASDEFYQGLGINPVLPTYGQTGAYEPKYKSYEQRGFIYRLDSLRRLGVRNIELKDGAWHPERHPEFRDVYEVTYP